MLSVKARKSADTIFKVFGLPYFAGERSNPRPRQSCSFNAKF